ncbi:FtsQ-type POTRA domain-containing protein [Streptomyces sp. NP160]|uniref:cell division protein FtsQ/DivIB n=1 Tax=Streptomyces sp. NP160 TaxID=2586637 RepID=UPI0011187BF3|nr:FtsQ-type POTRA domain-containing protein [Streptomyces sp. NP160]TNM63251.1 FtsQ-type POTRA domain-containing protein [Streptomyces sp. NP160]
MSPAGRRPPAPVRRPAPPRPQRDPDPQVRLPETGPATGPGADRPAPRPEPHHEPRFPAGAQPPPGGPRLDQQPARPPVRGGRAGRPARAAGAERDPAARRRLLWRALAVAALVVVLVGLVVWALLFSSLTALRTVVVTGAERTGAPAVQQAAADQLGRPLLRVDTGAVTERVEQLPWVASVQVHRDPAHRLRVVVVEKTPVAAVPAPGGAAGVVLIDGDGATITTADAAPEGVPLVQVDPGRGDAVRAASAVALALPAALREQVSAVTATGPDDVRLALRSGQSVVWGAPGDDALKARVAEQLLPREGVGRVDVSAPLAPATAP